MGNINCELKQIGSICLNKDTDINQVIFNNPKLGLKLIKLRSKYENENRYGIYVEDKPVKNNTKKAEVKKDGQEEKQNK